MQSYKIRKTTETVLYPIENEIKKMRAENNKSWNTLLWQIFSVVFSGIGTTLLCQDDLLPSLVKVIYCRITKKGIETVETDNLFIIFLEFLAAIIVFTIICLIINGLICLVNKSKDNKGTYENRKDTAEFFHKVIFNNIITGVSFIKKAKSCQEKINIVQLNKNNQKNVLSDEEKENFKSEEKLYTEERDLYISESIYYFKVANKQINDEHIFEHSFRKQYKQFLDEVGVAALDSCLSMYNIAILDLKKLNTDNRNLSEISNIQKQHTKFRKNYKDNLREFKLEKKIE